MASDTVMFLAVVLVALAIGLGVIAAYTGALTDRFPELTGRLAAVVRSLSGDDDAEQRWVMR